MTKELYQILEINETATAEEIKKAYRKLAIKWHPDKWMNKSLEERQKANEQMQKINKAYEILSDEEKKRRYDLGQTEFTTTDDFDLREWIRRENERINEEIGEIDDRLEKIKKLLKELAREEVAGNIRSEMLLNGVSHKHLDSNLWSPYSSIEEKVWNIEIGDDENDREGIDKRKLNEFKEKMIKAIREKKAQLVAEKVAKASSDLGRAKIKSIGAIEKELQDKGLKIEDLEVEYHNYEEEINSLPKIWKIRSFEDKVIEEIRRKSQSGNLGGFELKKGDFTWQKQPEIEKETIPPLSDKKFDEEPKKIEEKGFQKGNNYDNWTKEELIKKIEGLEAEIRQLKAEKVKEDELPEFQSLLSKKEEELKNSREKLISISSSTNQELKKPNPKLDNNFSSDWVISGAVLLVIVGLVALFIVKNKKKRKIS